LNFTDKVALVTGAGRGIGKAIAIAFAQADARVAINDVNPESCAKTADEIIALGGQAMACHADVANKLAVQSMLIDIEDRWGRVDILINNAGVEPHKPIVQLDEWDWNRTIDVNLKGAFLCSQSVGRMMRQQAVAPSSTSRRLPVGRPACAIDRLTWRARQD
jgi:NAD(P)-dependent dehydrogenase (short-subunit alcohol dehydrogenase family)